MSDTKASTTKKPNGVAKPEPAATDKPAKQKRPTAEQLQQLRRGGNYRFNPETGQFGLVRKPTQKAAKPGANAEAK